MKISNLLFYYAQGFEPFALPGCYFLTTYNCIRYDTFEARR